MMTAIPAQTDSANMVEPFFAYRESWTVRYNADAETITLERVSCGRVIVLPFKPFNHRRDLISYAHKRCF